MMQKLQRFGAAMLTPVLLFSFAITIVGIGTLCTTPAVVGHLASKSSLWYQVWYVVLQGGWTIFNQLPLLFAASIPGGLARKQPARCCIESLASYLTFCYFTSAFIEVWGGPLGIDYIANSSLVSNMSMVAGIKTLNTGVFGAIVIAVIVTGIHDRLYDAPVPEIFGMFSGSACVYSVCFFVMLILAGAAVVVVPVLQQALLWVHRAAIDNAPPSVGIFVFLERIAEPFGLHHIMYLPVYYDDLIVRGGIYSEWAKMLPELATNAQSLKDLAPWAGFAATGWSKVFGIPGIAAAFYATAKPEKRKPLLKLLIPVTATAVLCGVTEPFEFMFLFLAPGLFVLHALLAALMSAVMYLIGIVGVFSGGAFEMILFNVIPLSHAHGLAYIAALVFGLCFTGIYFVLFRAVILKFDIKTPGRGDKELGAYQSGSFLKSPLAFFSSFGNKRDAKNMSDDSAKKGQTKAAAEEELAKEDRAFAERIIELLGGKDNIDTLTNCSTRLRVEVNDPAKVADADAFVSAGTKGMISQERAVQVIVGLSVVRIRQHVDSILGA